MGRILGIPPSMVGRVVAKRRLLTMCVTKEIGGSPVTAVAFFRCEVVERPCVTP